MQSIYRINIIACHKPWRGSYVVLTERRDVFDYLASLDGTMFSEIIPMHLAQKDEYGYWERIEEAPEIEEDQYEETYEWFEKIGVDIETPYILLGETTLYTD